MTGSGSYDYTITENGLYSISNLVSAKTSTSHDSNAFININGLTVQQIKYTGNWAVSSVSLVAPLKVGDIISFHYGISTGTDNQRIVLYKLF